jgi:DNA-binding phage protein
MIATKTSLSDVAEFLETPAEMAFYLEACIQESDGDSAFIAGIGRYCSCQGNGPVRTRDWTVSGKSVEGTLR